MNDFNLSHNTLHYVGFTALTIIFKTNIHEEGCKSVVETFKTCW